MKIKAIGRYAYDLLRGHQQQIEKNQHEEHFDQFKAEQEKLIQSTSIGGYISPYQNAAQFDAQRALGAMNTQGMANVFYGGGGSGGSLGVAMGGGGSGGSLGVAMGGGQFTPLPTPDLEAGAWAAAISELENLWLVKFGSKWVHAPELDEFYQVACERLIKVKKMESHHITSISTPVYRIIE